MVTCLQKEHTRHVENVIIMFNHAIIACTGCYFYNVLFLCTIAQKANSTDTSLSNKQDVGKYQHLGLISLDLKAFLNLKNFNSMYKMRDKIWRKKGRLIHRRIRYF